MGLFEKWRKKRKPSAPPMPASRGEMAGAEPRPPSLQGAITEARPSLKECVDLRMSKTALYSPV